MSEPNSKATLSDSIYYTPTTTTTDFSKVPANDSKQNAQHINLNLYHPAYYNYSSSSQMYSGTTFETMNRSVTAPPSMPSHNIPVGSDPSISVHLAKELRELGRQLGLTDEDLATLPSSPSLRSATNPNTKLFDESEQRFFDNFLDNIFFDENLFADNPLPPALENTSYFAPGPSLSTSSTSQVFPVEKPQHKSAIHSALYDMISYPNKELSMHSAPTTPSSLFMGHDSGVASSIENNPSHTLISANVSATIEAPDTRTRKISSASSPSGIVTTADSIAVPTIPVKRKMNNGKSQRSSSKAKSSRVDKDSIHLSRGLDYESSPSDDREVKKEFVQNSQSPTPSSFEDRKEVSRSDRLRKGNKELLTEEEKRANHIASEQKRRNMIRSGFRDLTEIVPALRDMNNSKSTILFKAVDFIKRLERKNQRLKNKANALQKRLEESQGVPMYSLHNHHHQPPPSGHGGGESSTSSERQGYMYTLAYQNGQRSQVDNGNYFGGGASGDSGNQYSRGTEQSNPNGMVNCGADTVSIASAQDTARRLTISKS